MKLLLFFVIFSLGLLGSFGTPSPVTKEDLIKKTLQAEKSSTVSKEDVEFATKLLLELVEAGKRTSLAYGNADTYVDKILVNLKNYLQDHYNPLEKHNLGGGVQSFKLWGLNSIGRTGEAVLQNAVNKLTLDAHMGFTAVTGEASIHRKLWWLFWFTGKVHVDVKNIKLHVKLSVGLAGDMKPVLESLSIDDWGQIHTKITEGNWLGSIANWFPNIVTNFLKSMLPNMIKSAVNDVLKEVDFKFT